MEKSLPIARQILQALGGPANIQHVANCMTRVRIEVFDENQVDNQVLRQIDGIKGYVKQSDQHQLIAGPGAAAKLADELNSLLKRSDSNSQPMQASPDTIAQNKAAVKAKYQSWLSQFLRQLANVFIPLIPAFIASGLISSLINIVKRPDIAGNWLSHYPNLLALLTLLGNAIFVIMPILVGVNTAKVFGGSTALGGVMAGILTSPQLASIELFGHVLQPGRGGVIAVLLVVALMCWFEKWLRYRLPESLELILNPLITTVVTATLALLVLQPLGGILSDGITQGANWAITQGGFWVGALLAGSFLPLVLTGLHQGLVPIHVALVQQYGDNPLLPILAMAGVGQIGAAAAVLLKTSNQRLKRITKNALPVGLLGVGEPLIFGVTLPLGKPFIAACLGGAVGGALASVWHVATVITYGLSGLPLALTMIAGKTLDYLLACLAAIVVSFVLTLLLGFTDPDE